MKEGLFYPGPGSEGQRLLRPNCDTTPSGGASKRISTSGRAFACDFGKYCQRKDFAACRIMTDAEQRILLKPGAMIVEVTVGFRRRILAHSCSSRCCLLSMKER